MNEWISVNDRLPEIEPDCDHASVIIAFNDVVAFGVWRDRYFYEVDSIQYSLDFAPTVTHWMPLPSPPKTK